MANRTMHLAYSMDLRTFKNIHFEFKFSFNCSKVVFNFRVKSSKVFPAFLTFQQTRSLEFKINEPVFSKPQVYSINH